MEWLGGDKIEQETIKGKINKRAEPPQETGFEPEQLSTEFGCDAGQERNKGAV